ncbi:MAG: hypothetical protein ABIP78_02885 [Pyrinomonadaceae bacterium]
MRVLYIGVFLFVGLFSVVSNFAQGAEQSGMIKTANGILVVWNEPGNYYTIEIKGEKILPVEGHSLWFTVDGKFFQIVTAMKKEISVDLNKKDLDDKAILTAHRDWESDYISKTITAKIKVDSAWLKLSNGMDALAWSYEMPHVAEKQTARIQLYLSVSKRDRVFALNSVVEVENNEKAIRQFLVDTMNTLKPSDKPLSLEKVREQILKTD